MAHICHALACQRRCPPAHLMCATCWRSVPADLQAEVYRTVGLRGPRCDATWAPWWRAQARAVAHVAAEHEQTFDPKAWVARADAFAATLEALDAAEAVLS